MSNPNIKKYAKDFTSETGRIAGSKPKTPRIKTIIEKLLTTQVELSDLEKAKLKKFCGYIPEKVDREFLINVGLMQRAQKSDESMKLLYDIRGQKITGQNSEKTVNVNIADSVKSALNKLSD